MFIRILILNNVLLNPPLNLMVVYKMFTHHRRQIHIDYVAII